MAKNSSTRGYNLENHICPFVEDQAELEAVICARVSQNMSATEQIQNIVC